LLYFYSVFSFFLSFFSHLLSLFPLGLFPLLSFLLLPSDAQDVAGLVFVAVRAVPRVEVAGAIESEAPPGALFVELLCDGAVVRSANRSSFFDFRNLQPGGAYALRAWSNLPDRSHVHEAVTLPLNLSLSLPGRRLFVRVRLAVRERSEQPSGAQEGSPAAGAALVIVLAAVFLFRAPLVALLRPLGATRGERAVAAAAAAGVGGEKTGAAAGDKMSFLQGTTAQQRTNKRK
jgi:hypothetical protein